MAFLKVVVYVAGYGSAFLLLAGAVLLLFLGDAFGIQNARSDGYLLLALGISVLAIDIGLTLLLRREE